MRRYWIEKAQIQTSEVGALVNISGDLFHHLKDVCRIEEGSVFELLCGDQNGYVVRMMQTRGKQAQVEIIEIRKIEALGLPHLHLALSLPRFQKVDEIVEKCVELGVKSITPFTSQYSFVRKITDDLKSKQERWQRIVQAATRQSGRGDVMEVSDMTSLQEVLKNFNRNHNAHGLFAYEGEGEKAIRQALDELKPHSPQNLWVFVGSEGGFSEAEVGLFREHGMVPVSLGSQVLRVETACLALMSVIKYEFDLMS
ncbi:MAG: 16S rRNA (uracil(1498)-N(3))-methyltransferase [Bdellovibrionales bacterium]